MSQSQAALLAHDVHEIQRLLEAHPATIAPLSDFTDVDRHAHHMVVTDLFWQCWHLALGADHLLREALSAPLTAVERMLFEGLVALAYLQQHADAQREAVVLLAFSQLKVIAHFSDQADVITSREAVLERMPVDVVAEARRRLRTRPRTWSGKTIETMARESGVRGYDTTYRYFSAEAHLSIVGHYVRILPEGSRVRVQLGAPMSPANLEAHANFVRRLLHSAFRLFWNFTGEQIEFRSSDPENWNPPPSE